MPSVKKTRPISFEVIDKTKAMAALEVHAYVINKGRMIPNNDDVREQERRVKEFERIYSHSYYDVIVEIWKWYSYILGEKRDYSTEEIYGNYVSCISRVHKEPMKLMKYDKWN